MSERNEMPLKLPAAPTSTYVGASNCARDALSPILPSTLSLTSCRGRAEAFARSLSTKLRTLELQSEECVLMATDCENLHNEFVFDSTRADINWLSKRGNSTGKYMLETKSSCKKSLNPSDEHVLSNEDQTELDNKQMPKILNNIFIGEDVRKKSLTEVKTPIISHLSNGESTISASSSLPSLSACASSIDSMAECCQDIHPQVSSVVSEDSTLTTESENEEKCEVQIKIEHIEDNSNKMSNQEIITTLNHSDGDDEIGDECRPSNIRRCSSLKTGKTPPGTPGRKKIVRFADVLGLDLADVKTFLDEIPTIPKSAYEDLHNLDNETNAIFPRRDFKKVLVALFQQPETLPTFLDVVNEKRVCLERACVSDSTNQTITGWVRVRNLDFYKSLYIRYSFDGWRSFVDIQASYVENSCDGFSDRFTFTLYGNSLSVGQRLEFAVRFHCMGQQFWDNNDGVNYCFQCIESTSNQCKILTAPEQHPVSSKLSLSTSSIEMGSKSGAFKLRMMRAVHRPTMAAISAINLHDLKPLLQTDNILTSGDLWCSAFY